MVIISVLTIRNRTRKLKKKKKIVSKKLKKQRQDNFNRC